DMPLAVEPRNETNVGVGLEEVDARLVLRLPVAAGQPERLAIAHGDLDVVRRRERLSAANVRKRALEAIASNPPHAPRHLFFGEIVRFRRVDIVLTRQGFLGPKRLAPRHLVTLEQRTNRLVDVGGGEIVHAETDLVLGRAERRLENLPTGIR